MQFQAHQTFGFTTKANGIARELVNEIFISEAYEENSGLPEPTRKPFKAVWDTGATNTVISRRIVQELALKPSGRTTCRVVGSGDQEIHEYETETFYVNVYLPNRVMITGVRVSEGSVAGVDVLIGMDIITSGDLAVTNYNGQTWWTFRVPSNEPIDFVEEINQHSLHHNIRRDGANKSQLAKFINQKKKGMQKRKR